MHSSKLAQLAALGVNNPRLSVLLQMLHDQLAAARPTPELDAPEVAYAWRHYSQLIAAGDALVRDSTASSLLVPPTKVSETTIDALVQTQDAYIKRHRADAKHNEAVDDHQSKYLLEWHQRVKSHSERSHEDMLSSLWESGLSWRDIARLLKVSVAAVQKWRAGEKMSPKNFAHLRDFVAAYDTVAAHKPGVDIASWIDIPILTRIPVTPRDLWTNGDPSTFFEYALGDMKPEAALDVLDADWRLRYRDDGFETFVGADGNLSIRMKNR
jgi:DNA-binding transcriptional regulator YiaG